MADAESLINLQQDEEDVAAFIRENGGDLARDEHDPSVYWVTFRPASATSERYYSRVGWTAYPYAPASIKFADGVGGSLSAKSAWPVMTGYRADSFDICRPLSSEGYAIHPEWNEGSTAWVVDGNPFLWVVQTMQFHFDNDYQGRAS